MKIRVYPSCSSKEVTFCNKILAWPSKNKNIIELSLDRIFFWRVYTVLRGRGILETSTLSHIKVSLFALRYATAQSNHCNGGGKYNLLHWFTGRDDMMG